jgi:hypothetical protein
MERRTLLQSVAAVLFIDPVARLRLPAQAPTGLTDAHITTLKAVAEVVLPTALGDAGRADAVDRFALWIRNDREGADRGHSYGASILSQPSGPSPAARYPPQFAALDELAGAHGATSFASLPLAQRREVIETVLNQPQRVTAMPARPNGASLIADFMGYSAGRTARLRDASGNVLLGDALLADWRTRITRGTARVRAYYTVEPDRDSRLTIDPANRNRWGDPLPIIQHRLDAKTQARAGSTRDHIQQVFSAAANRRYRRRRARRERSSPQRNGANGRTNGGTELNCGASVPQQFPEQTQL